jgi:hypothetical protein
VRQGPDQPKRDIGGVGVGAWRHLRINLICGCSPIVRSRRWSCVLDRGSAVSRLGRQSCRSTSWSAGQVGCAGVETALRGRRRRGCSPRRDPGNHQRRARRTCSNRGTGRRTRTRHGRRGRAPITHDSPCQSGELRAMPSRRAIALIPSTRRCHPAAPRGSSSQPGGRGVPGHVDVRDSAPRAVALVPTTAYPVGSEAPIGAPRVV